MSQIAPIEWRSCEEYPSYEISSSGQVRRVSDGLIMQQKMGKDGYCLIGLTKDKKQTWGSVHRLVAKAFLGPPPTPKHEAAHNDGTRTNNEESNLRWATRADNFADKRIHGTAMIGEINPASKLTEAAVMQIRALYKPGVVTQRELGVLFGVSKVAIRYVINRKTWSHV